MPLKKTKVHIEEPNIGSKVELSPLTSVGSAATRNSFFPFEVLTAIFAFYLQRECHRFPLETLLLVCRFWTSVLLENQRLWAILDVWIGDIESAFFWGRQLPRRLERSGSTSPIFFTLLDAFTDSERHDAKVCQNCDAVQIVQEHAKACIRAVHGLDGAYCGRWRTIDINVYLLTLRNDIPYFSYPTPQLTAMSLHGLHIVSDRPSMFLVSTPSLEVINVQRCLIPALPDMRSVTSVHFRLGLGQWKNPESKETLFLKPLLSLNAVTYLSIDVPTAYSLPLDLPNLKMLHIGGIDIPQNLSEISMPTLQLLSIRFNNGLVAEKVPKCKNLPFERLIQIAVTFGFADIEEPGALVNAYKLLLQRCNKVEVIKVDSKTCSAILKLLREDLLLLDRPIHIGWMDCACMDLRAGEEERVMDIDYLVNAHGLGTVYDDWETYFDGLLGRGLVSSDSDDGDFRDTDSSDEDLYSSNELSSGSDASDEDD